MPLFVPVAAVRQTHGLTPSQYLGEATQLKSLRYRSAVCLLRQSTARQVFEQPVMARTVAPSSISWSSMLSVDTVSPKAEAALLLGVETGKATCGLLLAQRSVRFLSQVTMIARLRSGEYTHLAVQEVLEV